MDPLEKNTLIVARLGPPRADARARSALTRSQEWQNARVKLLQSEEYLETQTTRSDAQCFLAFTSCVLMLYWTALSDAILHAASISLFPDAFLMRLHQTRPQIRPARLRLRQSSSHKCRSLVSRRLAPRL
jgi:hypothetical protein